MAELPNPEDLKRKALFVPCKTKDHLHRWVKTYLGIDLPSSVVCANDTDHEPSNSCPLDILWEVYEAAMSGDKTKTFMLYYAARGCYKSVLASIIECLCMFHLRRDVGHMAANKTQSHWVQEYLANYLNREVLRDYKSSKNASEVSVTWYEKDGEIITMAQFKDLLNNGPDGATRGWEMKSYKTTVVVATLGGANGLHCSMMIMDELDLTSPEVISEAMMIPAPGKERGEPAMVLMTSSRKFAIGPVQDAIDNAHKTGLHIRHWNLIDVTKPCPPERHRPDLKKLPVFYSDTNLDTVDEETYKGFAEESKKLYKPDLAYAGCIMNCRMFAMCRGRLATEQKSNSRLLFDVDAVQTQFRQMTDTEKVQAQLLCWKPSRAGMIYPRLNRELHMMSAAQIARRVTGREFPDTLSKAQLITLLGTLDVQWFAGVDHGYTHCFAGVLGVKFGNLMFILDAFEVPGLEIDGKVHLLKDRFAPHNPAIFADTAQAGDNAFISKHGFRLRKWDKGPGSVVDGINVVRMKLNPVLGKPEMFFLAGDPHVEHLFDRLLRYAWVIDQSGEPTDQPNEKDDDLCDAFRYLVMNVFAPKGKITVSKEDPKEIAAKQYAQPTSHAEQIQQRIRELTGQAMPGEIQGRARGKKGNLVWDL